MVVKKEQCSDFTNIEIELSNIGKLLSNPARIKIINILLEKNQMSSSEIAALIPLARTTVLQHIASLKDGGWLITTTDGSNIKYQINSSIFNNVSNKIENFFLQCSKSEKNQDKPTKILFICTGNSCRSQMAEGFVNANKDKYNIEAVSSGTKPAPSIKPQAIRVMAEKNIDISKQYPKPTDEFVGDKSIDLVIIVCEEAEKECPYHFPFSKQKIFMPFKDPKTEEDFREIRDEIENKISYLLKELPRK